MSSKKSHPPILNLFQDEPEVRTGYQIGLQAQAAKELKFAVLVLPGR
jgi:hypothetical protein